MNITAQPDPIDPGDTVTVCLTDLTDEDGPGPFDIEVTVDLGPGQQSTETLSVERDNGSACTTWTSPSDFSGATFTGPGGEEARVSVAG